MYTYVLTAPPSGFYVDLRRYRDVVIAVVFRVIRKLQRNKLISLSDSLCGHA